MFRDFNELISVIFQLSPLVCVQMVSAQTEMVSAVEKCCHRVDALEDTVVSV